MRRGQVRRYTGAAINVISGESVTPGMKMKWTILNGVSIAVSILDCLSSEMWRCRASSSNADLNFESVLPEFNTRRTASL